MTDKLKELLDWMQRNHHNINVTNDGAKELDSFGIRGKPYEVTPAPVDKNTIMVCSFLTKPLMVADNHIGRCAECRRKIQYRPHASGAGRYICTECALREIRGDA